MLPHLVGILPLPEAFAPVRGARIEKFKVEVFLNRAATTPKQRREMTEEREFWGIGTPRAWKYNPLLRGTGTSPERKPLRFYPVFDSREKAERFVRGTEDIGGSTLQELLNNIRKIEPNEIPPDHDVSLNGDKPVKWSELTGDDAPPVGGLPGGMILILLTFFASLFAFVWATQTWDNAKAGTIFFVSLGLIAAGALMLISAIFIVTFIRSINK